MRLHLISDLHLEFVPFTLPKVQADVSILAGDVHLGVAGLRWILKNIPDRPVIYVLGNHEFYGTTIPRLSERLTRLARNANVTILENDSVQIGPVTFLGATLWTDLELYGDRETAEATAFNWMSDYRTIKFSPGRRRLIPQNLLDIHHASRRWLESRAARIHTPKVVITHHAPHPKSIASRFLNHRLNPAFVSDLTPLIKSTGAKLWFHGHIHANSDYTVGETRVLSNPRGYEDENPDFNPALVLEI